MDGLQWKIAIFFVGKPPENECPGTTRISWPGYTRISKPRNVSDFWHPECFNPPLKTPTLHRCEVPSISHEFAMRFEVAAGASMVGKGLNSKSNLRPIFHWDTKSKPTECDFEVKVTSKWRIWYTIRRHLFCLPWVKRCFKAHWVHRRNLSASLKSHIKAIQSWQGDQNRADREIVGSDHLRLPREWLIATGIVM